MVSGCHWVDEIRKLLAEFRVFSVVALIVVTISQLPPFTTLLTQNTAQRGLNTIGINWFSLFLIARIFFVFFTSLVCYQLTFFVLYFNKFVLLRAAGNLGGPT